MGVPELLLPPARHWSSGGAGAAPCVPNALRETICAAHPRRPKSSRQQGVLVLCFIAVLQPVVFAKALTC